MSFCNPIGQSPEFLQEQRDLRVQRTQIGCVLTLVLVPLGVALDYFAYPAQMQSISQVRLVCEVILLPVFALTFFPWGKQHIVPLSHLWGFAPALTISWILYLTDGAASPFYAGLNLVILGTCVLLPFSIVEAALYCTGVLVSYVFACAYHHAGIEAVGDFANNLIFIAMTSVICVTYCHLSASARRKDFGLRQTLREQNEQLAELDRMKTEFFANVSHELRTPLTLILGPLETALEEKRRLPERVAESLRHAHKNALRLLTLINDLLDLVRFESSKSPLKQAPLRLDRVVESLVESVRPTATRNQLDLHYEPPEHAVGVVADCSAVEKVLLNLLSNAMKFTTAGGALWVRLRAVDGRALIEVEDTGIGIPANQLPQIFDRFKQVDGSATRQHQGLGIGLALAKELVESCHGELTAESCLGKGTTFRVTYPLCDLQQLEGRFPHDGEVSATSAMATNARASGNHNSSTKSTRFVPDVRVPNNLSAETSRRPAILIVDDEEGIRQHLTSVLQDEYTVRAAEDGSQGFQLAVEDQFQVAILDMMMPGRSGLDLCRDLRGLTSSEDLKILMLTARVDEELKIEALRSGVDDFLTKPFSTVELKTRVANLVAAASLQHSLRQRNHELAEALKQLRLAESQLIQSEKMNALGSLAAGLLHEINNPLNHTLMAIGFARQCFEQLRSTDADLADTVAEGTDEILESLQDIEDGMKRIGEVIADLRAFAHPEAAGLAKAFGFQLAIDTALRFTARELTGVCVEVEVAPEATVMGAQTHITQVLVNLFVNAAHALKPTRDTRRPELVVDADIRDGRLAVTVRDNGCGIDDDIIPHVFEPFFTTRDVGEGTGLGLSVCHTIVENHGGTLSVSSKPDCWTEFHFDLPLANVGALSK